MTDNNETRQTNQQVGVEKPVWTTGHRYNKFFKLCTCGFSVALVFEILGKKTNMPQLQVSKSLANLTSVSKHFASLIGYGIAYISDIAFLFRRVYNLVYRLAEPVVTAVYEALSDIFGSTLRLFSESLSEFSSGYTTGLDGTTSKYLSFMTSLVVVGTTLTTVLLGLEAYGTAKNKNYLRPSFYIVKMIVDTFYS